MFFVKNQCQNTIKIRLFYQAHAVLKVIKVNLSCRLVTRFKMHRACFGQQQLQRLILVG